MDQKELDELKKELSLCQRYLAPLFSLEAKMDFGVKMSGKFLKVDYFWEDLELDFDLIELEAFGSKYDIGSRIGKQQYHIANPDLHKKGRTLFSKEFTKHRSDILLGVPHDPAYTIADAYETLFNVISASCGFSYSNFREFVEQNPIEISDNLIKDLWQRIADGQNDTYMSLGLIRNYKHRSCQEIAESLYRKRGYKIISELVHLDFDQARGLINEYVSVDIMDPEE